MEGIQELLFSFNPQTSSFLKQDGFLTDEEQEIYQQGARPKHHLGWPLVLLSPSLNCPSRTC